jgi:hypothetical protein
MKIGELTNKQLSSVVCPMCGLPSGLDCSLARAFTWIAKSSHASFETTPSAAPQGSFQGALMFEPTLVEKARREWKARRDSLFAREREKPSHIRLAVEVK